MNSSMQVLVDRLNKVCSEYVHEVVMECGKLYGFEGSEALSRLGLSEIPLLEKVEEKVSSKSSKSSKVSVEKKKEKKVSSVVEKKGRPKKSKKELEVQGEDLFAELILSAQKSLVPVPEVLAEVLEKVEEKVLEKVEEKVVVEKKKTNKKSEEKEAEKLALKDKKEAEKAAKEAEKLALKDKKEAEKISKKGDKKPVKKVEKVAEVSPEEVLSEILVPPFSKVEEILVPVALLEKVEEEDLDVVKKFEYEGVKYLKSKKTGIIYNMDQEVVGKWNEESEKIDFEEEDDSSDEEE